MPDRIAYFGKRSAAGQGVANVGMPTVVNSQRLESLGSKQFARCAKALPQRMAREYFCSSARLVGRHERITRLSVDPFGLPRRKIRKRPAVPPERHGPRPAALGRTRANP
jgi:hypothetical protein